MALLESALQAALHGDSHIVGVCGLPGSGKSRLCYEFSRAMPDG